MRVRLGLLLLRAFILIAFGTSIALLLDYTSPQPAFCGGDSGCAELRSSGFGQVPIGAAFSIPVPVFGVVAFGALFVLSLVAGRWRAFTVLRGLSFAGGAIALGLLVLQGWLGHFCSLCATVDISMLIIAGLCWFLGRDHGPDRPLPRGLVSIPSWVGLLGLALLAPLLFPRLVQRTQVPEVITKMYRPGEISVIEFFDFQCPHCRHLSPRLKKIVADFPKAKLRFGYAPLPGHDAARLAARMTICAGEQGREMELAQKYFEQSDMSDEALMNTALATVPDSGAFSACLVSDRPEERINEDTTALTQAGFVGLPTTYIGGMVILGAEHDRVYVDALRRVSAGKDRSGMPGWLYWVVVAGLAACIAYWGREPTSAGAADRGAAPAP